MSSTTILVVEDAPISLKLAAKVLRTEGYKVHIASTAEQALTALETLRPDLMLVDLELPGMNGLELTRRVRQNVRLNKMMVVALTACTIEGTEQTARDAGCDRYLTKPIDPSMLATRIREYVGQCRGAPVASAADIEPVVKPEPLFQAALFGLPECEMEDLWRGFLADGAVQSRDLLASFDSQFDAITASRLVHQWVGAAGLLGFARISELSQEVETLLRETPWSVDRLRVSLTNLARAFADPGVAATGAAIPDLIVQELVGKQIALIGFAKAKAEWLCAALERVGAIPILFEAGDPPDCPAIRDCSVVIVHVRPETLGVQWLAPEFVALPLLPLVLAGGLEHLLSLNPTVQSRAQAFLIDGWQAEEALMRLSFVLSQLRLKNLGRH